MSRTDNTLVPGGNRVFVLGSYSLAPAFATAHDAGRSSVRSASKMPVIRTSPFSSAWTVILRAS
jgi:hypothetical protein